MKKALSLFLAAIMCLTVFTLSTPVAFAASYNGTCGSGITWSINTSDGTLTISGSGQMDDYSLSSAPSWDRYQNYIKSVVFADGVTYVGDYAFYNGGNGYKYKKLTSVDFGSVDTIGNYAFRGCAALSEITGCDSVTKIYSNAFRGCTALTDFTFNNINEICEGAFYGAGLESINLPETTRTIRQTAFEDCRNAVEITIPRLTESIKDRAFADCTGVEYLNFCAASVATGIGVFNNTGSPDGMTLELGTYVSKIPDELFSGCYNMNEIIGGDRLSSIGAEAFAHTGITSFEIYTSLFTLSETAFEDCTSLEAFIVIGDNESFSADHMGVLLNKSGNQIIRYPSGRTAESYALPADIQSISDGAFKSAKYLKNFSAGNNISKIPSRCFSDCASLETVTLGSAVTTVDTCAFANCDNLETATMNGVTKLSSYAFAQCDSLTAIPTTSASGTSIGDFAFYDCDGFSNLIIPSNITSIGKYAFLNCRHITTLTVPSSVRSIYEGAFADCASLNSLTLQSGITTIDKYAFIDCTSLPSVTIPSSVTSIGTAAFGCKFGSGNTLVKLNGFKIFGGDNTMAQSYASSLSFPYTIVEAAYEDSTIAIDDSGTAIPSADTANEEIDPLFTFDAFDSFGSVAEFLMNFDYMSLFNKVVNFIITVVDYIGGILCA